MLAWLRERERERERERGKVKNRKRETLNPLFYFTHTAIVSSIFKILL